MRCPLDFFHIEGGKLFLHLHLPLLDHAYHLFNLQDFPVASPKGKHIILQTTDAVADNATTYALNAEALRRYYTIGNSYLSVLPYARHNFWGTCVKGLEDEVVSLPATTATVAILGISDVSLTIASMKEPNCYFVASDCECFYSVNYPAT